MANTRGGNTYYIDTQYSASISATTELVISNIRVHYVLVTGTTSNAHVVLSDNGITKLDLRVPNSGETRMFRFDAFPVLFTTSIRATTLANALVTVVFEETRR